jgi:hypothetical protein
MKIELTTGSIDTMLEFMAEDLEKIEEQIAEMLKAHYNPPSRGKEVAALIMQRLDFEGLVREQEAASDADTGDIDWTEIWSINPNNYGTLGSTPLEDKYNKAGQPFFKQNNSMVVTHNKTTHKAELSPLQGFTWKNLDVPPTATITIDPTKKNKSEYTFIIPKNEDGTDT